MQHDIQPHLLWALERLISTPTLGCPALLSAKSQALGTTKSPSTLGDAEVASQELCPAEQALLRALLPGLDDREGTALY